MEYNLIISIKQIFIHVKTSNKSFDFLDTIGNLKYKHCWLDFSSIIFLCVRMASFIVHAQHAHAEQ